MKVCVAVTSKNLHFVAPNFELLC